LPIILSGYVPGQEEGNVEYVVNNDVGVLATTSVELIDALRKLIKPGSPELRQRLKNVQKLSRPQASFEIAKCILSYLPEQSEESVWQTAHGQRRLHMMSGRMRSAIRIRRLRQRLPTTILQGPVMRRLRQFRARNMSDENVTGSINQDH
jgi:1,2-diacylglycerol 3-beta-galactosyltransferase